MTGSAQRPLLFLDVDGPLIPFGTAPQQYPTYQTVSSPRADANPLLARINPEHGTRLMALPCELVWATSWLDDANECISPRLGLPQLAIVTWPDAPETEADYRTLNEWLRGTTAHVPPAFIARDA